MVRSKVSTVDSPALRVLYIENCFNFSPSIRIKRHDLAYFALVASSIQGVESEHRALARAIPANYHGRLATVVRGRNVNVKAAEVCSTLGGSRFFFLESQSRSRLSSANSQRSLAFFFSSVMERN
jgi:hypothetical protein